MSSNDSLLSGIKVIDVASFIVGPAAATVLGDFGADVIKVEPLGSGDPYRDALVLPGYPESDHLHHWLVDNRNKRDIALDLKAQEGRDILYRLCAEADVFITNMPLGPRERLGIRYQDIKPHNPRIIFGSVTAYGERGPEAHRTGFDSTALWARSGLMDLVKPDPDAAPGRSAAGMGDHPTAMSLVAAIMMGLYRRERTGEGSEVATSLMANGMWSNSVQIQAILCGGSVPRRPRREDATTALNNLYRTRDGRWFHFLMITGEEKWPQFAEMVGHPNLATDSRFATNEARLANRQALIALLDDIFAERDAEAWRTLLTEAGFTYGETFTVEDAATDVQMRESGALRPTADPARCGATYVVDSPLEVVGLEKAPAGPAPEIGADTDAILAELGFDAAGVASLRSAKVVG